MEKLIEVYNIKDDHFLIKIIQERIQAENVSLGNKKSTELLLGTEEWFNAVELGVIPIEIERGTISGIYNGA